MGKITQISKYTLVFGALSLLVSLDVQGAQSSNNRLSKQQRQMSRAMRDEKGNPIEIPSPNSSAVKNSNSSAVKRSNPNVKKYFLPKNYQELPNGITMPKHQCSQYIQSAITRFEQLLAKRGASADVMNTLKQDWGKTVYSPELWNGNDWYKNDWISSKVCKDKVDGAVKHIRKIQTDWIRKVAKPAGGRVVAKSETSSGGGIAATQSIVQAPQVPTVAVKAFSSHTDLQTEVVQLRRENATLKRMICQAFQVGKK